MAATETKKGHANIHAALSALQGELKTLPKSKTVKIQQKEGPAYEFKYTPLDEIMSALYPLLGKHGLAIRTEMGEGFVECVLTHETTAEKETVLTDTKTEEAEGSFKKHDVIQRVDYRQQGEIRSGKLAIGTEFKDKYGNVDFKRLGSAITYVRRYLITNMLGIASEEDTDISLLEGRVEALESFAMKRAKEGIEAATTDAALKENIAFFDKELKAISDGKKPSLGLTKEQYDELIKLAGSKRNDLKKGAQAAGVDADDAPATPGENPEESTGDTVS